MDSIIPIILLILGVPLATGIWLIARAISARNQIEELTRRVDVLHLELTRLKHSKDPAPRATEERISAFMPAVVPPRRENQAATPAPVIPVAEAPAASDFKPEIPLVSQPKLAEPPLPPIPDLAKPELLSSPMACHSTTEREPAVAEPPVLPPPPIMPPPAISKRVAPVIPTPRAALETAQVSAALSPAAPVAAEQSSFEMRLGTFWLVRVGIVMLLAGLAFFANLAYHNFVSKLGPGGKISLLYLASGLLLGAGAWWQRRSVKASLQNYAQVLFAGGLAAVYFTTYAAHHVPPLEVIANALVDGILLLVWAGVIAWIADRRKSEVMALFAVGLAFFTSVITRVGEFTLYSNLILTLATLVFLVRNRWAGLSFASLATSYAGYAVWRFLHDDGWRWATPDENLWLGAGFLACYWLVFTAATFLSKSEKLSGPSRAAFLTLNNGAFFALFLLTMLQVHTGGFWKFSLTYGAVLLALALLAKRLLPAEPLTKNAYLTHGLVLVTLGFISKFAGLHLALVLGAESVVLYALATQRQSDVLKFSAYAAALLASGWYAASLNPFETQGLWTGAGLGVLLACNAVWAFRWENQVNPNPGRLESSSFTLLAFASWTLATWFNTPEPRALVALVLGVESLVFYQLIGGHQIAAPKIAAYASAVCAVAWCLATCKRFDATGLWTAIALGAHLISNSLRANRADQDNPRPLRPEPTVFTLLAFASWLAATWAHTTEAQLPLALAAEAVALTFSIYLLRVREITLLGQFFLIFAQVAWLFHYVNATPPWWHPLLIIAVTIGLSHWWQHQKTLVIRQNLLVCYSAVFALAAVALALVWLHPLLSAPAWLAVTSLLAVAVTGYGLLTRAWPLAICGQIFLGVSVWEFVTQLVHAQSEWYFPLAPLAVLAGLSFTTIAWLGREPKANPAVREPLLQVALVYRWLALAMSLLWVWDYVPERQRVWACMLAAVAVFALGLWRNAREALAAAAVYAVASLAQLWLHEDLVMDLYLPNLLSLVALFVLQQGLRRVSARLPLDEKVHGAIVVIAGISLWRFLSSWSAQATSGFSVTMTWAGFAVVVFTTGILLRERFLRWFGLSVLAASVGRVVLVDVWREQTIYRVLTFMALGVALLVVGFIYNKYQEKIRQWL